VNQRQACDLIAAERGEIGTEQMQGVAADVGKAIRAVGGAPQLENHCGQGARDVVQTALVVARAHLGIADIRDVNHRADNARHLAVRRRECTRPE
jgi:hypothetical protein